MRAMFATLRPLLFRLDPERAHDLTFAALRPGSGRAPAPTIRSCATTLAGLALPNPIGLAAGFDKDARVPGAMLRLGFGFVEIGTVTPRPQAGNPRPRIFRLVADRAVINRLGFNNGGVAAARRRGCAASRRAASSGSISARTRTAPTASPIMSPGVARRRALADYVTVNISSPNTPGLRGLQTPASSPR